MLCSWGDMAVAVTNNRRDSFRDIVPLHAVSVAAIALVLELSLALH
jgi:hypothetical protein